MTWTKSLTKTLPATGNRTVTMITEEGVQKVRYNVVDTSGEGYTATFTLAQFLADNPSVDAVALAAMMTAVRAYGDGLCGFTDQ